MSRWVCPRCDREFGAANQPHVCRPGLDVSTLLARHPPWVGEIYAALKAYVDTLGPVHEDAVEVGIFLKVDRTLAEFRPLVRSVRLWLMLPRAVEHDSIRRVERVAADRYAHVLALTSPDQVDEQLCEWLTQAYDHAS